MVHEEGYIFHVYKCIDVIHLSHHDWNTTFAIVRGEAYLKLLSVTFMCALKRQFVQFSQNVVQYYAREDRRKRTTL